MHKFLRAVGFSSYQNDDDIEQLIDILIKTSVNHRLIDIEQDKKVCEIRAEVSDGMGICLFGDIRENEKFRLKYYFPYLLSNDLTSNADCSIQRHTEKETYAGLLDEYRVGISLIFYMENSIEYRERILSGERTETEGACLTGLSVKGKILLPIKKTQKQIEMARIDSKKRSSLIEAAKNGDEDAMETLTVDDMDMYSKISRRIMKEDIYSIIDSSFMPCGIECDQYAVIGEIQQIEEKENHITGEVIYDLKLLCNDMTFHVGINKQDLLGEPQVGRRFKGKIWMQGTVKFKE